VRLRSVVNAILGKVPGNTLAEQRKSIGMPEGGGPAKTGSDADPVSKPTLSEAGIDKLRHVVDGNSSGDRLCSRATVAKVRARAA
jgi:hypothetical protein